jgi:hypothetical protein
MGFWWLLVLDGSASHDFAGDVVVAGICPIVAFRKPAIDVKSCYREAFKTGSATGLQSAACSTLWIGDSHTVRYIRHTPGFQC